MLNMYYDHLRLLFTSSILFCQSIWSIGSILGIKDLHGQFIKIELSRAIAQIKTISKTQKNVQFNGPKTKTRSYFKNNKIPLNIERKRCKFLLLHLFQNRFSYNKMREKHYAS